MIYMVIELTNLINKHYDSRYFKLFFIALLFKLSLTNSKAFCCVNPPLLTLNS